ncbi:MAG TPA: helix-turn-helix transcriptional regulator [Candidatus Acidoferrales bacterium]|nr:helix-turn-helix transcriptional regulator [Candidatus Acidoferrales bacterium]
MARQAIRPVGPILKAVRENLGLSQAAVGRRAGIEGSHVGRLESGVRTNPRWDVVARIAAGLGLSLDDLAARCGYDIPAKGSSEHIAAQVAEQIMVGQEHLQKVAVAQQKIAEIVGTRPRIRKPKR